MAAFPPYPNLRQRIRRYPLDSEATFNEGAAVMLDASGNVVESDESAILGFALHAAGELPEVGNVLVALALPDATFVLQGDRDPLATDVGDSFGLAKDADGDWIIDTDTSDCVQVEKVYLEDGRNQFEVIVLPAKRQLESGA